MKKLLLLVLTVLCIANVAVSQNLDKEKNYIEFTRLPKNPLPEDVTQYWVNIDLGYIYSGDSKTETLNKIKSAAQLDHLEKTANEGMELLVRLETYYKGDTEYLTKVKTEKRDDKEVKVTYHYLQFEYKYPLYFEVKLPGEVDPLNSGFSNYSNGMTTYKSKEFKNKSALNKWWSSSYKGEQRRIRMELLNKNVSALKRTLENQYSYTTVKEYTEFESVKKFKKFDYADLDKAIEYVKTALEAIEKTDVVFNDVFRSNMEEAIGIWKQALTESNLEERKTRINEKITEGIYNNIFLAYTLMSEFEMAEETREATKVVDEDVIERRKTDFFDERKSRFEANEGRIPASVE